MFVPMFLFFLLNFKISVLCFPSPQSTPNNGTPPINSTNSSQSLGSTSSALNSSQILQSLLQQTDKLSPSVFGSPNSKPIKYPNTFIHGFTNPGSVGSMGLQNPQIQYGASNAYRDNNNPIPFTGQLSSSVGNLGSSAINAKGQTISSLIDGASFGISRVPSFVGYGVQSVGRLEKAGEHLFKAAIDLGIGGLTNGMEGVATGMNIVNGLGTAGVKGITTLASGSARILEHILSLGTTEGGLINTLVALNRLLSPSQLANFQNSGLSLSTLTNAANYLGIPLNNSYLNTILSSASKLSNGVNMDSIRQAASSAANNLGLTQAWNILSSRLNPSGNGGNMMEAINAAASSNTPLPKPPSTNIQPLTNGEGIPLSALTNATTDNTATGSSWFNSWFG